MPVGVIRKRSSPRRTLTLPSWLATQPRSWMRWLALTMSSSSWRRVACMASPSGAGLRRVQGVDHADDHGADGAGVGAKELTDAGALGEHQDAVAGACLGVIHGEEAAAGGGAGGALG